MAFKMRSGHKPGFKNMGSSPTEGGSALQKSSPMKAIPLLPIAATAAYTAGRQLVKKGIQTGLTRTGAGKVIKNTVLNPIKTAGKGMWDKAKDIAKDAAVIGAITTGVSSLKGSKDKKPTTPVEGGIKKVNKDLSVNFDTGEVISQKQNAASAKINKKTKLGPPKGKLGSDYRKAEYDARGWKYDDTIAGYNRDGSKIKPTKTTTTKVVRKSTTPTKQVVKTKTKNDQGKVTKVDKIKSKQYKSGEKKKDVTVAKDKVTGSYTKTKVKYNKDGTVKKNYTTNISGKKAARMKRRADRRANR